MHTSLYFWFCRNQLYSDTIGEGRYQSCADFEVEMEVMYFCDMGPDPTSLIRIQECSNLFFSRDKLSFIKFFIRISFFLRIQSDLHPRQCFWCCMSKKSCPILYSAHTMKIGQDFLGIQYKWNMKSINEIVFYVFI